MANDPLEPLISGVLAMGVLYDGERHLDFTIRAAVVGDTIGAEAAYPEGPYSLFMADHMRRQLVKLGTIPIPAVTTDFLAAELHDTDLKIIQEAQNELEKKFMRARERLLSGDASNTSSLDTATV